MSYGQYLDTVDEAARVHAILRKHPLPTGIRGYRLEFGEDTTGDPAVTIWFVVDDNDDPTDNEVAETSRFVRKIKTELRESGLRHWPYTRFSPASEAKRLLGWT